MWWEPADFFGTSSTLQYCGVHPHLVGFYAGICLLTVATFVTLRLFGLQLIVVPLPRERCHAG